MHIQGVNGLRERMQSSQHNALILGTHGSSVCPHCLPSPWHVAAGHLHTTEHTCVTHSRNRYVGVAHVLASTRHGADYLENALSYKTLVRYRNRRHRRRLSGRTTGLLN